MAEHLSFMRCLVLNSIVKMNLLLDRGAAVDLKDNNGRTPLFYAISWNHSIVKMNLLLDRGATVDLKDNNGRTPLFYAIFLGDSIVKMNLLLDRGAAVDSKDNDGRTPLSWIMTFFDDGDGSHEDDEGDESDEDDEGENVKKVLTLLLDRGAVATPEQLEQIRSLPPKCTEVAPARS